MAHTTHMDQDEKKFEVVSNHKNTPKTLGTITVRDSKLEFSPQNLSQMFGDVFITTGGGVLTVKDGLDFIKAWPLYSGSGYVVIKPKEPSGP